MWFLYHGDVAQFSSLLKNVLLSTQQMWFLHDGAVAHFGLAVWEWLSMFLQFLCHGCDSQHTVIQQNCTYGTNGGKRKKKKKKKKLCENC
jgi:hypothetical protein